jgi:anaerobic selenocysteine-containing dehydrogenase
VAVHEQFMTDTAQLADVVLPATMFLEHDDIYRGGGHQHIILGPKLVEPPEGPRQNHDVIEALGKRLGVSDREGFGMTPREHIDIHAGKNAGLGDFESFKADKWADVQADFDDRAFPQRLRTPRRQVPLQTRLDQERPRPTSRPGAWGRKGRSINCPNSPIMSN